MGCGQGLVTRTSVLSVHGVQVLGFNDLGQQVVSEGRGNRQEDKHWVREEQAEGSHSSPPSPAQPSPSCLLSTLPYRMGIMAIMMRGKIIFM